MKLLFEQARIGFKVLISLLLLTATSCIIINNLIICNTKYDMKIKSYGLLALTIPAGGRRK
jgi:hypothetical protein